MTDRHIATDPAPAVMPEIFMTEPWRMRQDLITHVFQYVGKQVLFIGPSGSGKTTFLDAFARAQGLTHRPNRITLQPEDTPEQCCARLELSLGFHTAGAPDTPVLLLVDGGSEASDPVLEMLLAWSAVWAGQLRTLRYPLPFPTGHLLLCGRPVLETRLGGLEPEFAQRFQAIDMEPFSLEETRAFLRRLVFQSPFDYTLDPDAVQVLFDRSEGWPGRIVYHWHAHISGEPNPLPARRFSRQNQILSAAVVLGGLIWGGYGWLRAAPRVPQAPAQTLWEPATSAPFSLPPAPVRPVPEIPAPLPAELPPTEPLSALPPAYLDAATVFAPQIRSTEPDSAAPPVPTPAPPLPETPLPLRAETPPKPVTPPLQPTAVPALKPATAIHKPAETPQPPTRPRKPVPTRNTIRTHTAPASPARFTIQIAAHKDPKVLQRLVTRYQLRDTRCVPSTGSSPWSVLEWGAFADRATADAALAELRRQITDPKIRPWIRLRSTGSP